tara:strand:+ start:259 stop:426 length:168 start_codon:yes stop_codon:yes gene_type:complete
MKTSEKIRNIIDTQIGEDISSAWENQNITGPNYGELLEILVEVSKLEAANQTEGI